MNRRTRSAIFSACFLSVPSFALFHHTPDGDGAGGAGATTDDGGAGGSAAPTVTQQQPPAKTYDQATFNKVKGARDRLKRELKAVLKALNVDPEQVQFVETTDPQNPVAIEGLDEVITKLQSSGGMTQAEIDSLKSAARASVQRKLDVESKKVAALVDWIKQNGVVAPIQQACTLEGAIDDDDGKFSDIVMQLQGRMPVSVDYDEDSKQAVVTITTLDDDGEPLVKADGSPMTPRDLVADLLKRKPKYRAAEYRGGPGAGGKGNAQRQTVQSVTTTHSRPKPKDTVAAAVKAFTGVMPPSAAADDDE